jgi:transposase
VSNPYGNRYTAEFKRDAVALVNASPGRTVSEIARELGVSPEGLRGWVKQARTDATGGGGDGALTSAEREELAALRRRVREQDQVIGILKKAAAFFAQDNL